MARITIPESVIPGIKAIGLLSGQKTLLLYEKLRSFKKGSKLEEMESSMSDFLDDESSLISEAIYSFGHLIVRNDKNIEEIALDLRDSFLDLTKDEEVSQGLGDVILERITDILNLSDFLIPTFEAYRVVWESNSVLKSSEVLSDIVILNDKSYKIPASGIVLNKLNLLIRRTNGEDDRCSVVLDIDDLKKLKSQIQVAIDETEEMKKSYSEFLNLITL